MATIKEDLLAYVREEFLDEDDHLPLTAESPLISSGLVNSFSMVSLKRHLERTYRIMIPDALATPRSFDSVNQILELLKKLGVE